MACETAAVNPCQPLTHSINMLRRALQNKVCCLAADVQSVCPAAVLPACQPPVPCGSSKEVCLLATALSQL